MGPGQTDMTTPQEVDALFASTNLQFGNESLGNRLNDDGSMTEFELAQRVAQLSQVLITCQQLQALGSPDLGLIAEKIGDGSRDVSWRIPLGQSGLLDFFIGICCTDGLRQALAIHTLRIVGNSCADTDENRARVVAADCLPRIVKLLEDDSIIAFVIPVLFNICVDYEPAQVAIYKAGINPELISLISSIRLSNAEAFMNLICKLLGFAASQEPEANLVHLATPFVLLKLATNPNSVLDLEDFLGQTSVALTYLSHQQFQDAFLETPDSVPLFLKAFYTACLHFNGVQADSDEIQELKQVRNVFTQTLADLSANPLFAQVCPLDSRDVQTLQEWTSISSVHLQSGACLALGNLARSDAPCISLVQSAHIHHALVAILANPSNTDAQLLHSVLSFLKNLAIPASNKPILGEAGLLDANILPRIWGLGTQVQVQFAAVSLTRLLLVNCPANVTRICTPLSKDPDSPAHDRTHLYVLINLFTRSDQEPTKMEAARAVCAVLRVLHSAPDTEAIVPTPPSSPASGTEADHVYTTMPATKLARFYQKHDKISATFMYLATQTKFPVLRSELWFVLALMSRSEEGAHVVATNLNAEAMGALVQSVTGEDVTSWFGCEDPPGSGGGDAGETVSGTTTMATTVGGLDLEPQQVDPTKIATMGRVDRENGLVLIAELLQRCPEKLRPVFRESMREILQKGGQRVLDGRASGNP